MSTEEKLIEALKTYAIAQQDTAPSFEAEVFSECEAKKAIAEFCFTMKLDTCKVLEGLDFK